MKAVTIIGTRPEIVKMESVINALNNSEIENKILFSGQHYDYNMSLVFFEGFDLPEPDIFLDVKSDSQYNAVSNMVRSISPVLQSEKPDIVLVNGDTNTTLSAMIAAKKLDNKVKVAHVESGCRVFDTDMDEEINRKMVDSVSDFFFTPTQYCVNNLLNEGKEPSSIFLVGNTNVETVKRVASSSKKSKVLEKLSLAREGYVLVTVHRRENILYRENVLQIINSLNKLCEDFDVVFPMHPHTKKKLDEFGLLSKINGQIHIIEPVGFRDFTYLLKNAKFAMTDSGGIQQEAAAVNTPLITLRSSTEWIETVLCGKNILTECDEQHILEAINSLLINYGEIKAAANPYTEISVGRTIVDIVLRILQGKKVKKERIIEPLAWTRFDKGIITLAERNNQVQPMSSQLMKDDVVWFI